MNRHLEIFFVVICGFRNLSFVICCTEQVQHKPPNKLQKTMDEKWMNGGTYGFTDLFKVWCSPFQLSTFVDFLVRNLLLIALILNKLIFEKQLSVGL